MATIVIADGETVAKESPREYTKEEVTDHFLSHIRRMITYWEKEDRTPDVREKLEGLAHSILSAIDGCSTAVPAFIIAPYPHPSDKSYNKSQGENYYPQNHKAKVKCDIGGGLHERLYKK